jgi:hypothetical protein
MLIKSKVSSQTRNNWFVDAALLITAIGASISGVYFLFFTSGGYQGGRNPYYGIVLLFERATWSDIHTWTGVFMILVLMIHLPLHWKWVVNMTKRMVKNLTGQSPKLNNRSRFNIFIDALVAVSFLVVALSGVYLLFVPGGPNAAMSDPKILFSRTTWDLVHTWSGVVMILAGLIHFAIHWGWVKKVSRNIVHLDFSSQKEDTYQPNLNA